MLSAVACPSCNGTNRQPISPGFWQCTTLVWRDATSWGPAPGTPPQLGIMGPIPGAVQEPCGTQYHEATGLGEGGVATQGTCACGIFAIGQCSQCGRPVCGIHGKLFEGLLTCAEDIQAAKLRAKQEAQAAQEAAERASDNAAIKQILDRVESGPDAIARWLLTLGTNWSAASTAPGYMAKSATFKRQDALQSCISSLRELIRSASGSDRVNVNGQTPDKWTVADADLLQWLSSRSKPTDVMSAGTFRTIKGWIIGEGSQYFAGDYRSSGSTFYYRVFAATDGRVLTANKNEDRIEKWNLRSPGKLSQCADHLVKFI
jgi:hypothetical protein